MARHSDGLDQRFSNGDHDTWSGSGCILRLEPTRFANGWDLWFERKNEFQDHSKA